ncbi:hypothetical protein [Mailhella sp.]
MELSDKKLNTFQKGIWQKIFSLATYGVCIIATAYAVAFLIKNDILKALTAIQKSADLSEHTLRMLTAALDERGFALASIIIFSSVLLALASWFTVRWAGNRNWSTPVILPCAVEFRSAMDRLGVQKPRDRFDIIEKFCIPLYITEKPLLASENTDVQVRYYRHGAEADMRNIAMLESFIGCQKLCLDAGDFDFLASEYKRSFGTVNSSALASLKDQNDKLKAALSLKEHDAHEAAQELVRLREENAELFNKAKTADAREGKADKRERDRIAFWRVAAPLVNDLLAAPDTEYTRPQIQQAFEDELERHPELKPTIKALLYTPKKEQDGTPYSLEGWGMTLIREALGDRAKSSPGAGQKR